MRLDCDRLVFDRPLVSRPGYRQPGPEVRRMLGEVAELMRAHPELLLLRIDATVHVPPRASLEARSEALARANRHATAVFRHLWRGAGISAERLEPVGHIAPGKAGPVLIELRVMQWRR